jgi:hypothetical protein
MSDNEQLDKMLDNIMDDKHEQAEINFHDYLQGKMQDVLHGTVPDVDEDNETNDKD